MLGPKVKKWTARAASLLMLLAVFAVSARATSASAIDICKDAPAIERPDSGSAGLFLPKPDLAAYPDLPPDPWLDNRANFVDIYGTSASFFSYDIGCFPALTDTSAVVQTNLANTAMMDVNAYVAFVAATEQLATRMDLAWLQDSTAQVSGSIREEALGKWIPLALLVAGAMIVWASRKQDYAGTMKNVGTVAICLGLAYASLVVPTQLMKRGDEAIAQASSLTNANLSGSSADTVFRSAVLPVWVTGTFGAPDSPIATDYRARIWESTHYTWADVKGMKFHPEIKKNLDDAKHERFKKAAEEIKNKDPQAYDKMRGVNNGRPLTQAYIQTLLTSAFVVVAYLVMLLARVLMVALVIMAMFVSVVGLIPAATTSRMLRSLWDVFTANLVAVVKFGLAAKIVTLVMQGVMNAPALSGGGKVVAMAIVVIAAFALTRPLHTIKTMIPGMNTDSGFIPGFVKSGLATAVGTIAGVKLGRTVKEREGEEAAEEETRTVPKRELEASESLPALAPAEFEVRQQPREEAAASSPVSWSGYGRAPQADYTRLAGELDAAPAPRNEDEPTPRAQSAWVVGPDGRMAPDTGGIKTLTVHPDEAWRPPAAATVSPTTVVPPVQEWDDEATVIRLPSRGYAATELPPGRRTTVGTYRPEPGMEASSMYRPEPGMGASSATHHPGATRAVVLSGDQVAHHDAAMAEVVDAELVDDPTLYRSRRDGSSSREYVRLPEPVLAEDGTETTQVIYTSARGGAR